MFTQKRIKMVAAIVLSFGLTWFGTRSITSPSELASRAEYFVTNTIASRFVAQDSVRKNDAEQKDIIPLVKYTYAKEKRTTHYKGKEITYYAIDNKPLSPELLEFLYNVELEKEKNK